MFSLQFNFRDIFKANRLAFSLQRIWIQFIGLSVGYVGYLIFTYLSLIVTGNNFSTIWNQWGLFPCLAVTEASWYGWLIFIIGALFLLCTFLITNTAVSRAAYMLLKGNNFYTWKEAFAFSLRKTSSVILSPIAITVLILLFVVGGAVIGLLGKIPVVGELGLSLFYIGWFIAGLLIVFFTIILGTSLLLTPAIIATTDDDAFEAVFQAFSTFWNQPWRFILYEALSGILAIAGFLVLAFLVKKAFVVTDSIFLYAMGDKYSNLMTQGMFLLSGWVAVSINWMNSILGDSTSFFYFSNEFLQLNLSVILNISAYIFAIMMLVIGAWVVSYGLATFNVANTLIYLVLRKFKDKENLLERKDREEEEDEEIDEQVENEESTIKDKQETETDSNKKD